MKGLETEITAVSIPSETLKSISEAVNDPDNDADGLTVKLPEGSVTFDDKALAAIAEQAKGSDLKLNLDNIGADGLKAAQKTAIREMDVQDVYDAYMTSNGVRINDFKGGSARVTVTYTLKSGQTGGGIVVWYVADDGTKTEVPTRYTDREVTFTVEHFSNYVVAYDPERAANSYADCPQDDTCPISAFTDAEPKAWYHDGVHYVLDKGIMNGTGNGRFEPNTTTSRAMVVTILWRMEGEPASDYAVTFADVESDTWYTQAVRWAAQNGIVNGYSDAAFGPSDPITREQLATILYRYAQGKGADVSVGEDTNILSYDDVLAISAYAVSATQWAAGAGLMTGRTASTLNPKDSATRTEIATIIMRYCTQIAK